MNFQAPKWVWYEDQESKQRSVAPPPSYMLAQQSGTHCPLPWDLLQRWHSSAPPWKPISVVLLLKTEMYMLPLPQVIAMPLSILFVKVHVKYVLHYYYYYIMIWTLTQFCFRKKPKNVDVCPYYERIHIIIE